MVLESYVDWKDESIEWPGYGEMNDAFEEWQNKQDDYYTENTTWNAAIDWLKQRLNKTNQTENHV